MARVRPITDDDVGAVGVFLATTDLSLETTGAARRLTALGRSLWQRVARRRRAPEHAPGAEWVRAWLGTVNRRGSDAPNHGFMLWAQDRVVGIYLAIYSYRDIEGRQERFCSLAGWYVSPEYRAQSLLLLRAILAQPGYHFTDMRPNERVQKLNLRLGFRYLQAETALVPNLPWPALPQKPAGERIRISSDPAVIQATLSGPARTFYADHATCRHARHLVLLRGEESCYVLWRMVARRNLKVFAWILYASNPQLLRDGWRPLASRLLLRHGAAFTVVDTHVAGGRVRPWIVLPKQRQRRMFRGTVAPETVDYLYSEITSAP
jgi:hypothetical protein